MAENLTIGYPEAVIMITSPAVPDRAAAALPPGGAPLSLITAEGNAGDVYGVLAMPSEEVLR